MAQEADQPGFEVTGGRLVIDSHLQRETGFMWQAVVSRTDEEDGCRLVAHEHRGQPELKIITVEDGMESFAILPLTDDGQAVNPEQAETLGKTLERAAEELNVDPKDALSSLYAMQEWGIPWQTEVAAE